jgi:hypothetical protein
MLSQAQRVVGPILLTVCSHERRSCNQTTILFCHFVSKLPHLNHKKKTGIKYEIFTFPASPLLNLSASP